MKSLKRLTVCILAASLLVVVSACSRNETTDMSGIHEAESETLVSGDSIKDDGTVDTGDEPGGEDNGAGEVENAIVLSGDGTSSGETSATAAVKSEIVTYEDGNISIEYPVLSNLPSDVSEDKVNELLKEKATQIITAYELSGETSTASITCNVLSLDRSRAVISYSGYVSMEGASYPLDVFYTTTVDLKTGDLVRLINYADPYTIAEYVQSDECVFTKAADTDAALFEMNLYDTDILSELLAKSDFSADDDSNFPESFSYENQGDIYVVIPVTHAAGDYVIAKFTPETK